MSEEARFCLVCGEPLTHRQLPADDRPRAVCTRCGWVHYDNPRIIVGSVCLCGARVLLCRRALEPRAGFWTIPAGFLELGESIEEGAAREAREEACADIAVEGPIAVYSIPRIGQVQIMFRARLLDERVEPGLESLEVGLFDWDEIPWELLAFPTVGKALARARQLANADPPFAVVSESLGPAAATRE